MASWIRIPAWLKTEKALVAVLGLAAASVLPITTLIQSRTQLALEDARRQTELNLQEEKQKHDIRMAYFEKAVAGDPEESRMRVLRFLAHSFEDAELQRWAWEELELTAGYLPLEDICKQRHERCIENCRNTGWKQVPWGQGFDVENKALLDAFVDCRRSCWHAVSTECHARGALERAKARAAKPLMSLPEEDNSATAADGPN